MLGATVDTTTRPQYSASVSDDLPTKGKYDYVIGFVHFYGKKFTFSLNSVCNLKANHFVPLKF